MTDQPTQPYPNGEDHPSYVIAYQAWVVLFLGIICVGLLNYIAFWFKRG